MLFHISFYKFVPIADVDKVVDTVKALASELVGLVLLAEEGINGTLAATAERLDTFEQALAAHPVTAPLFGDMGFKRTVCITPPFGRLKVTRKREVVDMGVFGVDTSKPAGVSLKPAEWKSFIRRDDVVVIDNRNSFEFRLGRFENAIDPEVRNFRDFPQYIETHLPQWQADGKKIAMYCTGGIRCEKTAAWLEEKGVESYQLEGGILNYFKEIPDAERDWSGECFVFDNRIALDTKLQETGRTYEEVYAAEPDGQWRLERAQRLHSPVRKGISPSVVVCPQGTWPTVLDFLCERFPMVNREAWVRRMRDGEVADSAGRLVSEGQAYRAHVKLLYYRMVDSEPRVPFEERIVFANERIVVADKPHFLPVMPSGRYVSETLLVRLRKRLGLDELTQAHRIDRETAGLVLFTTEPRYRNTYQALFRQRRIEKEYEAIAPLNPTLQFPLQLSQFLDQDRHFMQMHVVEGGNQAPNAIVDIELLERWEHCARYRLKPLTGVRHQLRVQMAHLGLPILNDQIYPVLQPEPTVSQLEAHYQNPLQLLAKRLSFTDPVSGEFLSFTSQFELSSPV